jgi:hypothetical protein
LTCTAIALRRSQQYVKAEFVGPGSQMREIIGAKRRIGNEQRGQYWRTRDEDVIGRSINPSALQSCHC